MKKYYLVNEETRKFTPHRFYGYEEIPQMPREDGEKQDKCYKEMWVCEVTNLVRQFGLTYGDLHGYGYTRYVVK